MENYSFKAVCTWGEGPDVMVTMPRNPQESGFDLMELGGGWSVGLTIEQAEVLLSTLQNAVDEAKKCENMEPFKTKDVSNNDRD